MALPAKLLEQVRDCIRTRHLAYRTEKIYLYWIRRFLWFHEAAGPRQHRFSDLARCRQQGLRFYTESGIGRSPVPVSRYVGVGMTLAGGRGARQAARSPTGRS